MDEIFFQCLAKVNPDWAVKLRVYREEVQQKLVLAKEKGIVAASEEIDARVAQVREYMIKEEGKPLPDWVEEFLQSDWYRNFQTEKIILDKMEDLEIMVSS